MPTTSQVPMLDMQQTFQQLIEKDFEVLGIFISAKLSGTLQSAIQARETLGAAGGKISLVDSNTTAMAMGFIILAAARCRRTRRQCERMRCACGKSQGACRSLFCDGHARVPASRRANWRRYAFHRVRVEFKPILALKDGRVEAEDRVRTKSKAIDRILELVGEQVKGKSNIRVATLHANAEDEARILLDRATKEFNAIESILSSVSPVVGVHAGPGTVGLAFMADI